MADNWTLEQVREQLDSGLAWTSSVITYAFPDTTARFYANDAIAGFRAVNATQQAFFTLAIQAWDDLIARSFQLTTAASSHLEFAYSSTMDDGAYAYAYYPSIGNAWFSALVTDTQNSIVAPTIGRHGFTSIMHEIGHAIGLAHMGDYNGAGTWTPSSYQDSRVLSIMSYFSPTTPGVMNADWVSASGVTHTAQTPMLNDVMAIQAKYGAAGDTRTGDTIYGFASNVTGTMQQIFDFSRNLNPILTLFDSAGNDTLDLSGWSTPADVSLVAGTYSSCNAMTNNIAIAYDCVIENAIGGSGSDLLRGNSANNRLAGGAGSDALTGAAGDDTLDGGAGADDIDGGDGTDTCIFTGTYASYTITYDSATAVYRFVDAGGITDVVANVELFQFSDQSKSLDALSYDVNNLIPSAPILLTLTPGDDGVNVALSANLVFAFSETVQAGHGNIVLYNANGTVARTFAVTDATQVSFMGNRLTVNPAIDLPPNTSYYVGIDADVVTDEEGNGFAGIAGATAFNFTTVNVADDFALTAVGSGQISAGGSAVLGVVNYVDDGDLFKVVLAAHTTYRFDLKATIPIGLVDPYLQLFDAALDLVTFDDNGGGLRDARIIHTAGTAGTYYLAARDASAGTGTYTLAATALADDYRGTVASANATITPNGAAASGSVNFATDHDVFIVVLEAGKNYVFTLAKTAGAGLGDPHLNLLSASSEVLAFGDDAGGSERSTITYAPAASGTYYLDVSDHATGTGSYTLLATGAHIDRPHTGAVVITGSAVQGQTLTATHTLADLDGLGPITYQWHAAGTAIAGASAATYVVTEADVGKTLTVVASYTDGFGTLETAVSAATSAVTGIITGSTTPGADLIRGTERNDTLVGGAGNDTLTGGPGDDLLDGGAGIDTAVFRGSRAEHEGTDGRDAFVGIERFRYADVGIARDLDGNAGQVARILGAVFGAAGVANRTYVGIGLGYADSGLGAEQLVQLALDARLGTGASHADVVALLYRNLTGTAPDAATRTYYEGLLHSGTKTPAQLGLMAADQTPNFNVVDLVGLAASGLEYV